MDSYLKWRTSQDNTILKFHRSTPYYKRSRDHSCKRYPMGDCHRGAHCPYALELPSGELQKQKALLYQLDNPVARKLLVTKGAEMPPLEPPDDMSIRTLYVSRLDGRITELDLRDNFYAYGEIETLKMVPSQACAFITYMTRESAEKAAKELPNKLLIKGLWPKLMWDRPQPPKPDSVVTDEARPASSSSQ